MRLHLPSGRLFQQQRALNDLAGFNEGNAQRMFQILRIRKRERLIRAFAVEQPADNAVDMRKKSDQQFPARSRQRMFRWGQCFSKGYDCFQHAASGRVHWGAKEPRRFPGAISFVFKGGNAAEFPTVVRQKDWADIPEGEATALEFFLQRSQL